MKKSVKPIRLLAMDVDGVLTGGQIIVLHSGEEIKLWNAKDRLVLALLRDSPLTLKVAWITGRKSKTVEKNAKELGVTYLFQKCHDKIKALEQIARKEKLAFKNIAYIGDDLIDLPVLHSVGFSACPQDAASDVRRSVDYVSDKKGGEACVRDIIELILKGQGQWAKLIRPYLQPHGKRRSQILL